MSSILAGRDPSRVVEDDPLVSREHVPMKKRGPKTKSDCRFCGARGYRFRGSFARMCAYCRGSGVDPDAER